MFEETPSYWELRNILSSLINNKIDGKFDWIVQNKYTEIPKDLLPAHVAIQECLLWSIK
jgi:hypothetical protein